jgi:exopolyphosphatase/guanosine-5'-triphosphate,3'-diphosphate pyrophosphatase
VGTAKTSDGRCELLKAAVIDLGYNSAKMVSFFVEQDGRFRPFRQDAFKAKLGEGLNETGFLGDEPMRRTIECLKVFREVAELESIDRVLPVATSAVREAANRVEFLARAMKETRLAFRVLSGKEEALYSFAGAIGFVPIPDVVFFDLGGGSLEIVRAVDFRIKKILSLPLGALRLSLAYGGGDGTFDGDGIEKMKEQIERLLPSAEEMKVRKKTTLIGVGGSVRAIARYQQDVEDYPFPKIQGYPISRKSVNWISRSFLRMSHDELSVENSIGARAETIVAGAYVVRMLMRSLGFGELVVSAHGLREGTLSMYLNDQRSFHVGRVTEEQVERLIASLAKVMDSPPRGSFSAFERARLLDGRSAMILSEGIRLISHTPPTVNLRSLFFALLEEDSRFSHSEQVLVALAAVCARNDRVAEHLSDEYSEFTSKKDRKIVKRLSVFFAFGETVERTGANVRIFKNGRELRVRLNGGKKPLPAALLASQARAIAEELDMRLSVSFSESSKVLLPRMDVSR